VSRPGEMAQCAGVCYASLLVATSTETGELVSIPPRGSLEVNIQRELDERAAGRALECSAFAEPLVPLRAWS